MNIKAHYATTKGNITNMNHSTPVFFFCLLRPLFTYSLIMYWMFFF